MGHLIGGVNRRLIVLVGLLVVLGGAAAYIWYQKFVDEGVIAFETDPDISIWEASEVNGLTISPHELENARVNAQEETVTRKFHFKVYNNSKYEIKAINVRIRLFDADGKEIYSEVGRAGGYIDGRTGYMGTLLPFGSSESSVNYEISNSTMKEYVRGGRYEYEMVDVALYQNIGNRNKLSHFLASVARGDTGAVRSSLSKWRNLATDRNDRGIGAMWIASSYNNVEMLSLIEDYGGEVEWGVPGRRDLIHMAAANGATEALDYLVAKGANIDLLDGRGETALHIAVTGHHTESANFLIDAGADLSILNTTGVSPFHLTCWMRNLELVKACVPKGADIEQRSSTQTTPLLYAANTGSVEIMKYLLKQGADIHAKDETNSNILMYVVASDNVDAVKFILSKNFSLTETDDNGDTPYSFAIKNERNKVAALVKP